MLKNQSGIISTDELEQQTRKTNLNDKGGLTILDPKLKVKIHDENIILHQGWLSKEGLLVHSWKKRYFKLFLNRLEYFKKPDDKKPIKAIPILPHTQIGEAPEKSNQQHYTFKLITKKRTLFMSASNREQLLDWIQQVRYAIRLLNQKKLLQEDKKRNQSIIIQNNNISLNDKRLSQNSLNSLQQQTIIDEFNKLFFTESNQFEFSPKINNLQPLEITKQYQVIYKTSSQYEKPQPFIGGFSLNLKGTFYIIISEDHQIQYIGFHSIILNKETKLFFSLLDVDKVHNQSNRPTIGGQLDLKNINNKVGGNNVNNSKSSSFHKLFQLNNQSKNNLIFQLDKKQIEFQFLDENALQFIVLQLKLLPTLPVEINQSLNKEVGETKLISNWMKSGNTTTIGNVNNNNNNGGNITNRGMLSPIEEDEYSFKLTVRSDEELSDEDEEDDDEDFDDDEEEWTTTTTKNNNKENNEEEQPSEDEEDFKNEESIHSRTIIENNSNNKKKSHIEHENEDDEETDSDDDLDDSVFNAVLGGGVNTNNAVVDDELSIISSTTTTTNVKTTTLGDSDSSKGDNKSTTTFYSKIIRENNAILTSPPKRKEIQNLIVKKTEIRNNVKNIEKNLQQEFITLFSDLYYNMYINRQLEVTKLQSSEIIVFADEKIVDRLFTSIIKKPLTNFNLKEFNITFGLIYLTKHFLWFNSVEGLKQYQWVIHLAHIEKVEINIENLILRLKIKDDINHVYISLNANEDFNILNNQELNFIDFIILDIHEIPTIREKRFISSLRVVFSFIHKIQFAFQLDRQVFHFDNQVIEEIVKEVDDRKEDNNHNNNNTDTFLSTESKYTGSDDSDKSVELSKYEFTANSFKDSLIANYFEKDNKPNHHHNNNLDTENDETIFDMADEEEGEFFELENYEIEQVRRFKNRKVNLIVKQNVMDDSKVIEARSSSGKTILERKITDEMNVATLSKNLFSITFPPIKKGRKSETIKFSGQPTVVQSIVHYLTDLLLSNEDY
ncbi:hypothetical protein ABK040_009236 [Willaertia magna]